MIFLNKLCSKCEHQMTVVITPEENDEFLKGNVEFIEGKCPGCNTSWIVMRGYIHRINSRS